MSAHRPIFADRHEAGRQLAEALRPWAREAPIVLALPRGGVPVAYEVASELDAPLDLLFVRKIGAPRHPELGLGALVDGADPQIVLNREVVEMVSPPAGYIEHEVHAQLEEIERRRAAYLGDREPLTVRGRTVLVVDDGVATGGTVRAALKGLAKAAAARRILAVPVGPAEVIADLREACDEVVCLATPEPFHAVGLWYRDFDQTSDEEVIELMARAGGRFASEGPRRADEAPADDHAR